MPLHGLRKSKEPGIQPALDIRRVGLDLEKKVEIAYPVPAEFELLYTQEDWDHWVELLDSLIKAREYVNKPKEVFDSLFCLKVLDPERTAALLTPQLKEIFKAWIKNAQFFYQHLSLLGRCCYLFSETPQQAMSEIKITRERLYRFIVADNSCNVLLDVLTFAYLSFPEFLPQKKLMEYWPKLLKAFEENEFIEQLQAAAYLRILFPEHLAELDLTSERIQRDRIESTKGRLGGMAYCKILAWPEIPGLTTWPPENSTKPQLAENIPEQPQQLAI